VKLESDLTFAIGLAREAGELVLPYFRAGAAPDRKGDGTYVTAADKAAETLVRERISRRFPNDAILGEEHGEQAGSSGRRWIVDPIDGTFSFVAGVPLFGVLVALEIDGVPSVGVAHFPALGETLDAACGMGCRRNGAPVRTRPTARLADALVSGNEPFAAAALVHSAASYRGWGDCYGYALVACGRADVAFDPVTAIWDCAALLPIIEEAGGTFTDWSGKRTIDGGNAVATNGPLFDEVIAALRRAPAPSASGRSGN
jgi:histidinol phosphatase-like enzyme (inositol monophosphatase family)